MPQVIPFVVKAVTFIVSAGAATSPWALTTAMIARFAVAVGMTVYQRQQTKKALAQLGGTANLDQGRMVTVREAAATRKLIYGQMRVGGTLVYAGVSGSSKEYLHLVIAHADHECQEIGDVYLNDEVVPLDGSGNATGKYAGFVTVKKHLGADSQTVDTDLQTAVTSGVWSNDHRLRGICYSYVQLKHSPDLFPSGIPNFSAIIKGRIIYDPRTATTAWSANPALCLRDYLLLSADRAGLGADSAEIDDDAVEAAANICDESVNLNPSGTETRYLAHGLIDTATEPGVVISGLCSAMAGICPYVGGVFKIKAGAHTASVLTITEDEIRGSLNFSSRDSLRNAFNGVKGSYVSSKTAYQPADFPPVVNATYTTEDGGARIWRDIALGFTTSSSCAQRLAKIELERGRQDTVVNFRTSLKCIEAHVGDVIALTLARYGWSAKLFEVINCKFYVEDGDNPVLGLEWTVRETASGVWDWSNGEETTVDLAPNTTLVDPFTVPAVSTFAAAAAPSGELTAQPRVKCSWAAPANAAVTKTELQYKKTSAGSWTDWSSPPVDVLFDYVTDLEVGVSYDFRARHVNNRGVRGAWTSTATVSSAPSGLTNYAVTLTNFRHGVRTDTEGTALSGELGSGGRATTDVKAWAGNLALTPVASAPGAGQFSISVALQAGTSTFTKVDADTVRIDTLGSDSTTVRFTFDLEGLATRTEDWIVWRTYDGGAYWLLASAAAANKSLAAAYTPAAITFTGKAILTGSIGAANYSARFKIAYWNGSSWIDDYTSASDENSKAYTIPAGSFTKFRCQLYKAGSFSTFLDEIEVPITNDGATGATGSTGAAGASGGSVAGTSSGTSNLPNTTYVDILSVTCTVDATTHQITATVQITNQDTSQRTTVAQLYRDSTPIGTTVYTPQAAGPGVQGSFTITAADTPGAGTYTYKLKAKLSSSPGDTDTDGVLIVS
jgi:hypothetical protein